METDNVEMGVSVANEWGVMHSVPSYIAKHFDRRKNELLSQNFLLLLTNQTHSVPCCNTLLILRELFENFFIKVFTLLLNNILNLLFINEFIVHREIMCSWGRCGLRSDCSEVQTSCNIANIKEHWSAPWAMSRCALGVYPQTLSPLRMPQPCREIHINYAEKTNFRNIIMRLKLN